jgi:hypothetical protein
MITIRKTENWSPSIRRGVKDLPPRLKMAPVMEKVEQYVLTMASFLDHIADGADAIKPNLWRLEAAWGYAFNVEKLDEQTETEEVEEAQNVVRLTTVEEYHEVYDIILALTAFEAPGEIVSVNFDELQSFEELVVLYHMLNARLKIDYARLHRDRKTHLTVRDVQLLSSMRESSVRNAISSPSGRKLNSILTNEGQRLIPTEDAEAWLEGCRWYRPTDLSVPESKEFVETVNSCLDIFDWHEG